MKAERKSWCVLGFLAAGVLLANTGSARTDKAAIPRGGTVAGSNAFYNVYVQDLPDEGIGLYTATTGPGHPAGSGLNVLYGDGDPGTSFNTIRSYTSGTDYIQNDGGSSVNPTVWLDPYGTVTPIGTTGARTTYVLPGPPETPDALTIIQDVNVHGTTFDSSTVEITTKVINNGTGSVAIGIRYLWDYQIGCDDGPTFQQRNPAGAVLAYETDFPAPTFESYQMTDNGCNPAPPTFDIWGTVTGPATVVPAPTAPDRLVFASWPNSFDETFDYTADSSLAIALGDGSSPTDDTAVVYYFGQDNAHAITIPAGGTNTVSASLFLTPPVPIYELTLTPTVATNTVGQTHTVTALVTGNVSPVTNVTVNFAVTGANSASGQAVTLTAGTCSFSYTGNNAGDDLITATATVDATNLMATATKTYLPASGGPDADGDGVPDAIDQCPNTPRGAIVDATGCSIAQLVPCDGPASGGTWKSHGQYVRAVVVTATDFLRARLITRRQWAEIVTRAACSRCGWNRRCDHDGDRDWHRDWDCDRDRDWGRARNWDR